MTRTRRQLAWRSRLTRFLSTLSVVALALVGVVVGVAPAQAAPVITDLTELIRSRPDLKHMELVAWLKQAHGLGHGHANALVAATLKPARS